MSRTYKHQPLVQYKSTDRKKATRHHRRVVKHNIRNNSIERIPELRTVSNKRDWKIDSMQAARYFETVLPWGWQNE